jgi:hypothetical protein
MFTHPGLTSQLAREHHHQMLAGASRRQLRRRHGRQATRNAGGAGKVIRRLAAAIAGAGIAALPDSTTEPPEPLATAEPAAGRPHPAAALSGCRRTGSGAAHVMRGRERDAR